MPNLPHDPKAHSIVQMGPVTRPIQLCDACTMWWAQHTNFPIASLLHQRFCWSESVTFDSVTIQITFDIAHITKMRITGTISKRSNNYACRATFCNMYGCTYKMENPTATVTTRYGCACRARTLHIHIFSISLYTNGCTPPCPRFLVSDDMLA